MNYTPTFDVFSMQQAQPTGSGTPAPLDDEARLSEDLLREYSGGPKREWTDQFIEDWDFYMAAQTSSRQKKTAKKRKQKTYNADVIYQAVEQAVAMLTANRPRFTSTGTEDSDTSIAQIWAFIMQHVWNFNNGAMLLKHTTKDYYIGSLGWMYLYWDPTACYGKGEFRIASFDPRYVHVSPASREFLFDDSPHIVAESYLTSEMLQHEMNIPLEVIATLTPHQESIQSSTRTSEISSGSASKAAGSETQYRRIDRFSKVKAKVFVIEKEDERFEKVVDTPFMTKWMNETMCLVSRRGDITTYFVHPRNVNAVSGLIRQHGFIFHEVSTPDGSTVIMSGAEGSVQYQDGYAPVPGSTTSLEFRTMRDLIFWGVVKVRNEYAPRTQHTISIGGRTFQQTVIPTEFSPMVPFINNFDRTPYPNGDVRRVKGEQDFINDIRRLVVTHAARTTNYKVTYPEGRYTESQLEAIWNDPNKTFLPYSAELTSAGMQVLAPPPLPNHLYTLEQQARKNIEERLGIFALMQGSPTDAPNTYKGTVALDEYGQRRTRSKREDIEFSINRLGRILVDLVPYYYTDTRVINIVGPNDKPLTVSLVNDSRFTNLMENNEFRIQDITVGRYDIQVVSGSTLPSNRWALLETYRQLYVDGLIDQEEVLKKTDVADTEKVLERMSIIKGLQEQLASAQMQIKQLSGDMQTAQREVINARRETLVERSRSEIKGEEVKAAAARMVYEKSLEMLKQAHKKGDSKS